MNNLIAELERATEGNRDLDTSIWSAVRCPTLFNDRPHYTTSLDAALTLVPAGVMWEVGTMEGEAKVCWESAPSYYTEFATAESYAEDGDTFNAALALTIAALRARQAMEEQPSC